jgi:hypothetical protein
MIYRHLGKEGVRKDFRQAMKIFDPEKFLRFQKAACKYQVHTFYPTASVRLRPSSMHDQ